MSNLIQIGVHLLPEPLNMRGVVADSIATNKGITASAPSVVVLQKTPY